VEVLYEVVWGIRPVVAVERLFVVPSGFPVILVDFGFAVLAEKN